MPNLNLESHLRLLAPIEEAFHEFVTNDMELFVLGTQGISEQTITFRLGYYLQTIFRRPYTVDCEYNRRRYSQKEWAYCDKRTWMKPDIVVHQRNSGENLFAIEAKKAKGWGGEGLKRLTAKLCTLTVTPGDYEYPLGIGWRIAESTEINSHRLFWYCFGIEFMETAILGFNQDVSDGLRRFF